MSDVITDAAKAERMLRSALGGKPELSEQQIADLMVIASSIDELGMTQYTEEGLNRAANLGWGWKAALTADKYDMGGGPGRSLTRSQWHIFCSGMQAKYSSGGLSVTGGMVGRPSGIRTIGLVSSAAVEAETWPSWVVNAPETGE